MGGACDEAPAGPGPAGPVGPAGSVGPVDVDVSSEGIVGSGTIVSESRPASGVERVVLAGEGRLIIAQDGNESLITETDNNLLEYIETSVEDNTLTIRTRSGVDIGPTNGVVYRLSVVEVTAVELSGAGSVEGAELSASALELVLSGVGDFTISGLAAEALAVELSGTGSITVDGVTQTQTVDVSGLGEYVAAELRSEEAEVSARGAASATVWVTTTLDITADDSGSASYYGSPQTTQQQNGLGSITALGDK